MQLTHNTVLITGGSSGIGLALAQSLINKNNKVITCGRSAKKLEKAREQLPGLHTFPCDVSKPNDRLLLRDWIVDHHPECNILVNNAAIVHKTNFYEDEEMLPKAEQEIQTNLMAPIALCKLFLPILERNKHAAMINITTGLVYVPRVAYPIYNATKAGLHAFTQVLRQQLARRPITIIEVMMTVVDTPWHHGTPPKIAISPQAAVAEMISKIEKGKFEIHIGKVRLLYILSRLAPGFAFKKINEIR